MSSSMNEMKWDDNYQAKTKQPFTITTLYHKMNKSMETQLFCIQYIMNALDVIIYSTFIKYCGGARTVRLTLCWPIAQFLCPGQLLPYHPQRNEILLGTAIGQGMVDYHRRYVDRGKYSLDWITDLICLLCAMKLSPSLCPTPYSIKIRWPRGLWVHWVI